MSGQKLLDALADELMWQHESRPDHRCSTACRAKNLLDGYTKYKILLARPKHPHGDIMETRQ